MESDSAETRDRLSVKAVMPPWDVLPEAKPNSDMGAAAPSTGLVRPTVVFLVPRGIGPA
jgi:hypothetical protein